MKDRRPISLCNVLYKIISKVLANRLKTILPTCTSQEQSTFVAGRSILDNTLVQHMECKVRGKEAKITLKIDISKSFDKVDWKYLNAILLQMGFDVTWVNWMKLCVETMDFNVLVNGEGVRLIIRERTQTE